MKIVVMHKAIVTLNPEKTLGLNGIRTQAEAHGQFRIKRSDVTNDDFYYQVVLRLKKKKK